MTTVHAQHTAHRWLAITKGSPEAVLPLCSMSRCAMAHNTPDLRAFVTA
jgi:magnesium-transporting ATPase (P-type)